MNSDTYHQQSTSYMDGIGEIAHITAKCSQQLRLFQKYPYFPDLILSENY